jgi:hypothetical protein
LEALDRELSADASSSNTPLPKAAAKTEVAMRVEAAGPSDAQDEDEIAIFGAT